MEEDPDGQASCVELVLVTCLAQFGPLARRPTWKAMP